MDATAALAARLTASVVEQDAPHQLRGDPKKVGTILPLDLPLINQPDKSLVHQGRGLHRVTRTLSPHVASREPMQLVVHQRQQLSQRRLVALAPGQEQLSHFFR